MRAKLIAVDGGASIDLVKELTLLGRDEDCDIRLDLKSISKLHCVIVKTDGLLLIRDLGSTNGTRVNGQRVRRAALLPNDTLGVANTKYRVMFGVDLGPEDTPAPKHEKVEVAALPAQRNVLPDLYPDTRTPRGS